MKKYGLLIIFIAVVFSFSLIFWINSFTFEEPLPEINSDNSVVPSVIGAGGGGFNSNVSGGEIPVSEAGESRVDSENDLILRKRERLFDYSRSGNFDDTQAVLRSAFHEGLITADEYYGELAHMLSESVKNPLEIISEIVGSGNRYGFEVLVSTLNENKMLADSMSQGDRADVLEMLNKHKPVIGGYVWELGVSDVIWYENWVGSLKVFSTEKAFVENLNSIIENGIVDPREAFGIYSVLYRNNYSEKISRSALNKFNFYINEYLRSYPDNRVARYTLE